MDTRSNGSATLVAPRTVQVRALTYNVPDTYGTSWKPGVFNASLRNRLPAVCWSHDRRRVVGKVVDWTDTPGGLDLTIQLADPDAVPDARMVQSLLQDGMVDGVSVGFANAQDEPDPLHPGVRRFTRASLPEVSFVLAPSVPGARVLSMRSISESSLDELLDELGAGIRSGRVSQDAAHATYKAALVRHRAQQRQVSAADVAAAIATCRIAESRGAGPSQADVTAYVRRRQQGIVSHGGFREPIPPPDPSWDGVALPPIVPPPPPIPNDYWTQADPAYPPADLRHLGYDDGVLHTAPPPVRRIPRDLLGAAPPEFDQFGDFQIVD